MKALLLLALCLAGCSPHETWPRRMTLADVDSMSALPWRDSVMIAERGRPAVTLTREPERADTVHDIGDYGRSLKADPALAAHVLGEWMKADRPASLKWFRDSLLVWSVSSTMSPRDRYRNFGGYYYDMHEPPPRERHHGIMIEPPSRTLFVIGSDPRPAGEVIDVVRNLTGVGDSTQGGGFGTMRLGPRTWRVTDWRNR